MTCDKRRDNVSLKSAASWRRSRPADTKSRGPSTPRHRKRVRVSKNRCAIDTEPLPWALGDSGHTNGHGVAHPSTARGGGRELAAGRRDRLVVRKRTGRAANESRIRKQHSARSGRGRSRLGLEGAV